tara:strand:- start:130 stop:1089 length:960 start_codon:yes stop_codon:yes gene_type:complete
MSKSFFNDLMIPSPDINLNCSGGTQAEITSCIMLKFEKELMQYPSDLVLVVGDVTSTMACAITAQKLKIKVAHVEGGIRSDDWSMPEEINRIVTDSISNYFYTTSEKANQNLISMGINKEKIIFVGNTMIDTLLKNINRLIKPKIWQKLSLQKKEFLVITLHRPSNVDNKTRLKELLDKIVNSSDNLKIIFPMHPRTKTIYEKLNLNYSNLHVISPLPYLEFNFLVKNSLAVITDSGGISEETTIMNIPCITLRDSTERPETVTIGTNEIIGTNPENIPMYLNKIISKTWKKGGVPKFWDGKASSRIVKHLLKINSNES